MRAMRRSSDLLRRAAQSVLGKQQKAAKSGPFSRGVFTSANPLQARLCGEQQPLKADLAFTLVGAAAAVIYLNRTTALSGPETLEPDALEELARDLSSSNTADKERAVSMLSSLTPYLEYHSAMLGAGVFPALIKAVLDARMIPQVRVIALGCAADLLKENDAKKAAASNPDFIPNLLNALKSEGGWENGPEEGGIARASAARALAELCAAPELHGTISKTGAAQALAEHGAEAAEVSKSEDKTYSSLSEVPGTMVERHAVEDERFTAAALYNLACSSTGVTSILNAATNAVVGLGRWASSKDPILQRYGVGALSRMSTSSPRAFRAVVDSGCLPALVAATASDDAQAQCFAAGAIGKLVDLGEGPAQLLLEANAPSALIAMLNEGRHSAPAAIGGSSKGVQRGVQRCSVRAILSTLSSDAFCKELLAAGVLPKVQAVLNSGLNEKTDAELINIIGQIIGNLQAERMVTRAS
ncbi:hypothetical protein CVIRNUC_005381 [Coccomyxa viridis]|uniref:Uncharacterized protein n=1 Tax=Coccomyxa viridis TaxID=1274662 RepID=A0AAV1I8N6_9CHLO|nr:hypothetical protein CVIRNUC_005381 [Coccomyxa viridis]